MENGYFSRIMAWYRANLKDTLFLVFLSIAGIIFSIILISVIYRPQIYKFLNDSNLIPTDERFTELYFSNHGTTTPDMMVAGKRISFSFTVHSLEGADKDYPYLVYFKSSDGSTSLIDKNTFTLKDDETKIINEVYTVKKTGEVGNVVVYLQSSDQLIHLMIPNR